MSAPVLVWFRRDLRLADQAAVWAAAQRAGR
jgi:deoxyribodipyrimidine photolyase